MPSPLDLIDLHFLRTAVAELLLLAVAGGLLGGLIVLRRLAFFTHAVGGATFPGLVVADAAGIRPAIAALAVGLAYAGGVQRAGDGERGPSDAASGLLLVGALATGVVLASDVFGSGSSVDRLLFGTLIGIGGGDLALSCGVAAAALAATLALGPAWVAGGFDREGTRAAGAPVGLLDALLLALVAVAVVAALPAVGALLVTAVFVVPAATARLVTKSVRGLLAGAVVLAAVEGVAGLYVAYWLDVSPGPSIAVLGAAVYGCVALAAALPRRAAAPRAVAA
jgi:ABC-type Mn2+/Zn2+ transport system permease subunit